SSNPYQASAQDGTEEQTRQLVSTLLTQSGLSGTSWADTTSVGYKAAVLGWRSRTVEGALYVKQGDTSQMATDLRSKEAEACKGTFIATKPVSEVAGNTSVKSYEFVCDEGETMSGSATVEVEDHKGHDNLFLVKDSNGQENVT